MGFHIVLQPNGRYARFSTVVDNFTDWNLTEIEMRDRLLDNVGRHLLSEYIEDAKSTPDEYEKKLATIEAVHGKKQADNWRMIVTTPAEMPQPQLAIEQSVWETVSRQQKIRVYSASVSGVYGSAPTIEHLLLFLHLFDEERLARAMQECIGTEGQTFDLPHMTQALWDACMQCLKSDTEV